MIFVFLQATSVLATDGEKGPPDRVTVKGHTLEGYIEQIDAEGIELSTIYGRGLIRISYEDISALSTQRMFRIYHGKDDWIIGQLLGSERGFLLIGREEQTTRIPIAEISVGIPEDDYLSSRLKRLRTDFRHWRAEVRLGWTFEKTAVDKDKIEIGLNTTHRRRPTRVDFDFRYSYEFQKTEQDVGADTKDELSVFLLGEYDANEHWFGFVRPAGEYDIPRSIKFRFFPAAGIGYRFYEDANQLLQMPFGIGYVKEEFEDFGDNTYMAGYVGLESIYRFENGIRMKTNVLYMPEISDPGSDWLLRINFDVTFPIAGPVAMTFRVTNVNDNNQAPGVGNNKFKTQLAMAFVFN